MKNLKVQKKLIVSFLIVIALTAIVGIVGVIGIMQLEQAGTDMYNEEVEPLPYIARVSERLQRTRVAVREMILGVVENNRAAVDLAFENILLYVGQITEDFDAYSVRIANDEIRHHFDAGRMMFEQDLVPVVLGIHAASLEGDVPRILALLEDCRYYAELIIADFERCLELSVLDASASNVASSLLGRALLIIIAAVLAVSVVVALMLALYISGLISKPLKILNGFMKHAGSTGDITLSDEDYRKMEMLGSVKDEIGEVNKYTGAYIIHISNMAKELEAIAEGDLTREIKVLSDTDTIGKALKRVSDSLNGMFAEVKSSAAQVASGSKQIAEGAQSLAQGSTEQASSVQELSSSVTDIAQKTKDNAGLAERAATLANDIKTSAEKGSGQMNEMMAAVKEINESSQNISKVNQGIDRVAQVTQQNSATAEESAAASQEMSGQSLMLEEMISRFKLKSMDDVPLEVSAPRKQITAESTAEEIEFGKY